MRLLVLNFFPAFTPAFSGGELRLGSLYRALSATHQVTMLTSTDFGARREEIRHTPHFTEHRFPKDQLWAQSYATLAAAGMEGDLSGLAFALAVSDPGCALRRLARELAREMDRVVHEFPFSEPVFADMTSAGSGATSDLAPREIYNSHNFETSLLGSVVHGPGFDTALLKLMRLEGNLARRAELVFATCQSDCEKFRLFYGVPAERLALCPNGFDAAELEPVARGRARGMIQWLAPATSARARPRLLFMGSAHPPNVEAARFLVGLAASLPECDVVLAGSVCAALEASIAADALPANLVRLGPVDPAIKQRLLSEADVFLNPVTLGSGTSLKALEALGAGVPMVSTEEGVRGLDVIAGRHAAVVSRARFAVAIRTLLADRPALQRLADEGRALAERRFTWSAIAAAFAGRLAAVATASEPAPPLVLALNDYPVLGGNSGGMARVRALLRHADAEVVLVSFGDGAEFVLLAAGLLHVTVPKTAAHLAFEAALRDGQPVSANDVAAALFVGSNRLMGAMLPELARRAGAIVLEHCYMAPALDLISPGLADLPVVYSSHNVEATHKPPLLAGHVARASLTRFVASLESRLIAVARLILCCTDADARHFEAALDATGRPGDETCVVTVVPNGCEMPSLPEPEPLGAAGTMPIAGFLGSAHGPNVEAGAFILRELAPRLPGVTFAFIGGVCEAIVAAGSALPENVRLLGVLDEADKSAAMAGWTIALNPVTSGGGSSLKLPDFMAHGLASLNTPAGARGFAVEARGAGAVVPLHLFGRQLAALLDQPDQLAEMGRRARRYAADELSWVAVTAQHREELHRLLDRRSSAAARRPRMLVVTYRYTEPTLGGAEEYLVEVLQRLRPRLERLDLACVDVGPLTNHHHFATRAGPGEGVTRRVGALFDQLHCLAADSADETATLAHCRDLERAWTCEEEQLLLPFSRRLARPERPVLLAGFYWPENHDGVLRRWTSPQFSILVPADATVLRIAGWVAERKHLRVDVLLPAVASRTNEASIIGALDRSLDGSFVAAFALPQKLDAMVPGGFLQLRCSVDETQAPGDHRPFGMLLEAVSVLRTVGEPARSGALALLEEWKADFTAENDRVLRAADFPGWVAALHATAAERPPGIDAAFQAVRGPHSTALQDWLAQHGGEYDVVLAQGVPFDLVPSTVATLAALPRPPRIVTLPHFHADDRFYHWHRFTESFARADATLLFTPSLPALLGGDAMSGRFAVVPGGGVREDEHGDPTARWRFAEVHRSDRPFFLVLGRKTGSKGYRRVLAAHRALRDRNPGTPDLVLIGPDEDGQPVQAPGVAYLGRQPREVIRGALGACIALITMSESESFGIVLCEAWLFGRPVIANRACYSFRDLVSDGETGLLVDSDVELAGAMAKLAADRELGWRMGQAGFEIVQRYYTWTGVADQIAAVLMPASEREPARRELEAMDAD